MPEHPARRVGTVLLLAGAALAGVAGGGAGLAFAAVTVFALGLPHGATDLRLVAAGDRAGFVAAYLLAAGGVLLLWQAAPGAALAAFLLLSAAHFAGDARPGEGAAVAMTIVGGPALLHARAVAALFEGVGLGASAAAMAGALLGVAGAAGAAATLAVCVRSPDRAGALLPGTGAAVLLPVLPGFAAAFVLLHAWPELRRQASADGRSLGRHLALALPAMAGAVGVCVVAALALRGRPAPDAAALFGALSALATPHMLVTPLWVARPRPAAAR